MSKNNSWPGPTPFALTGMITSPKIDPSRRGAAPTTKARRKRAEKILLEQGGKSPENLETLPVEAVRHAFQELQVHQIELEMQNEELQRIQEELEVARARYVNLYDLAPVGYCTISETGLILEANLTAARMLGVERRGLIRQLLSRFIFKEDQNSYYQFRKEHFNTFSTVRQEPSQADSVRNGVTHNCELRMVAKDGAMFWANMQVTATEDANSAPIYRMVLSDISEHKEAEAQQAILEGMGRQLRKAESLERMAGAITHIVNNQLRVVTSNLETTLEDMADDALTRQNLIDALEAARRSTEISGQILTYLGQGGDTSEPVDISEVCRQIQDKTQADMPGDIILETELLPQGPVVNANARQMQQILGNLVANGREAIGNRPGRITVTTRILQVSAIPRTIFSDAGPLGNPPGYYGLLEVTDTGGGMSEDEKGKIFDPFFSTKFADRGLGLAAVAGLVKAWGGMIEVRSTAGKGRTFRIFLPMATDVVPPGMGVRKGTLQVGAGDAVLLVEDEDMVRSVAEEMLKRLGFTVFAAADGNEAIGLFEREHKNIRCLITNLTMPDMDVWQTLAVLRKIKPQLPAILSGGYDELRALQGEYAEISQAFLHKPYMMDDFKNVLGRVLAETQGEAD
jgi:two-component system, cell cycle sensor histidine kinase and response regulator CckA